MATLALGIAGSAIGNALLPGGLSLFGSTLTGRAIGSALGAIGGSFADQALLGPLTGASGQSSTPTGPRLSDLKLGSSSEGTPLPRVYGRVRLPGQLIWATRFLEKKQKVKQAQATGGKNFTAPQSKGNKTVEYTYFANVAYAICEGPVAAVSKIWADGKKLKAKDYDFTVYLGDETQEPDSYIESKEGSGKVPGYRGTAYVVFKKMPLAKFGNRLPQLNFEVIRPFDTFEDQARAVTMIPGAGEFIYDPEPVVAKGDSAETQNVHTDEADTDILNSLNQLDDLLPNVGTVALIVTWFGTDLRIGHCQIRAGVETPEKDTKPYQWQAGGVDREHAYLVSQTGGRPAYGGTPADKSVVKAIQKLKDRGYSVTVYPFIAMDIAAGNSLPNPYDGSTGQPVYPWRGRITCDPAPLADDTVDKTGDCATQVAAFVGTAARGDFSIDGKVVNYSGPDEWSFRRFILHCAHLCVAAGDVDAFLIGTELRGATQLRSDGSTFPFVEALVDLAAEVRDLFDHHDLSGTKIVYGADWSEHPAYVPADGSGDVFFHLDPLWASDAIDAVGIDCYWPLADWRDGNDHLDFVPGRTIYDLDYLKGNVRGGEAFDFYYPSAGATGNEPSPERVSQTRLPITDGAYDKPWVFKPKAILEWWQNQHYNRPGGVEDGSPTAWVPQSKPIWFTELGCGAVDKGANQPNVFIDPKSSESFAPYFSRITRDDLMQRRYLQAMLGFFDPDDPDYIAGSNPTSSVYHAPMLDLANVYLYTWDARPYPEFPLALSVWADGANWQLGHWLTGRVGGGALASMLARLLEDYGFTLYDTGGVSGSLDGFLIDRLMSARDAIEPLSLAYFFDAYESSGRIHFKRRGLDGSVATLTPDDLVEADASNPLYTLTRGQETELPLSAKITFINEGKDYVQGSVEARRLTVQSDRVSAAELPIVMRREAAQQIAESWLREAWAARETASFALPPSRLALEPADLVTLDAGGRSYQLRLTEARDALYKDITALSIEPRIYGPVRVPEQTQEPTLPQADAPATAFFLDLPIWDADDDENAGYIAADANPWPGAIAFYRSPSDSGFALNTTAEIEATYGETVFDVYSGPLYRYDRSNVIRVHLAQGELVSVTEEALLGGANLAAIKNADGEWELLQFQNAELVDVDTYDLSVLLRGQFGTEDAMRDPVAAGATVLLLDDGVTQVEMSRDDIGLPYNWSYGPVDAELDDIAFTTESHAFTGRGLKPYRPVHVEGRRDAATGDWLLTWIRRTRAGGDNWDAADVPLDEQAELYELEVYDGGDVIRTVTGLGTAAYKYLASDQVADFGEAQSSLSLRIYQKSAAYGRGTPAIGEVFA